MPCQRSRCTAAQTPSGTAQVSAKAIDSTTRKALAVIFCRIRGPIFCLKISDVPKSPVKIPPIQRRYCTASGSFRPRLCRSPASASGFDWVPKIIIATSPGRTLVTAKVATEMMNSVSASDRRRLRM